jgi:hypothetical protein
LRGGFRLQCTPGFDERWRVAVQLEPHERRRKCRAVHDAALVARRRIRIAQMPLEHQDLPQKLHIAARERQNAESRAKVFRPAMVLVEQSQRNQQ